MRKIKLEKLAMIAVEICLYIITKLSGLFSAVSFVNDPANFPHGDNILSVIHISDDCRYDSMNDK